MMRQYPIYAKCISILLTPPPLCLSLLRRLNTSHDSLQAFVSYIHKLIIQILIHILFLTRYHTPTGERHLCFLALEYIQFKSSCSNTDTSIVCLWTILGFSINIDAREIFQQCRLHTKQNKHHHRGTTVCIKYEKPKMSVLIKCMFLNLKYPILCIL